MTRLVAEYDVMYQVPGLGGEAIVSARSRVWVLPDI
jgi:hypothetical protein